MKKKLLILAAVAVSGLAAVVASNVNVAMAVRAAECMSAIEHTSCGDYCCAYDKNSDSCCILIFDEPVYSRRSSVQEVE